VSTRGLVGIIRRRKQPPRIAGRGLSPHFVYLGVNAFSIELAQKALSVQNQAVEITDRYAEKMKEAQKSETGFRDRSGDTRKSVTVGSRQSNRGYEVEVGPEWPASGPPVARFLVFGTVKMPSKWDLFGLSQPAMNTWQLEMERLARL